MDKAASNDTSPARLQAQPESERETEKQHVGRRDVEVLRETVRLRWASGCVARCGYALSICMLGVQEN